MKKGTNFGVNDLFTWASENNPKLIKEYSKNNKKDIHDISRASNIEVEWVCSNCKHIWRARVADRARFKAGCPACTSASLRRDRVISGVNDLYTWASKNKPILIKEYSPRNEIDIHNIARASNREVEWVCSKCNHVWKAKVIRRTQDGNECPACKKGSIISI